MRSETPVVLLDGATRKPVEGIFVEEVTPNEIVTAEALWQPFQLDLLRRSLIAGVIAADLPQHAHWEWEAKVQEASAETRFYGILCQGDFQGLMALKPGRCLSKGYLGMPLLYADYLAAAPWNNAAYLARLGEPARFRRVGQTLIENAIRLSHDAGYGGRIGLHSLPQAESFYATTLGMTDFGRDLTYYGLRYFERIPA